MLKNCKKQIYQEEILQNIYNVPDISCFKESYNLSKNPQATFTLAFLFNYIQTHNKTVIIITHDMEIIPYCNKTIDFNKINKK